MSRTQKVPQRAQRFHFEVFGRRNSKDSLHHLGYISGPNEEYARSHAMMTYDEHRWVEFIMVRREHLIPIRDDGAYRVGIA